MSNPDGQNPNFDDFDAFSVPDLETPSENQPVEPVVEPIEIDTAEPENEPTEGGGDVAAEEIEEKSAKVSKLPFPIEWMVGAGILVVLIVLVIFQLIYPSTAIFLIAVALVAFGVWSERETNTAYTVLLACALVAILTAIYCLWSELGRYQFNVSGKQSSSITLPVQDSSLANVVGTLRVPTV